MTIVGMCLCTLRLARGHLVIMVLQTLAFSSHGPNLVPFLISNRSKRQICAAL